MSKYTNDNFWKSFEVARKGLKLAFRSQRNFRYHIVIAVLVTLLAIALKFSYIDFCILFLLIGFVMVAELFNSVIEFSLDAYYKNKYSKLVKMAKDMAAGGVLIATLTSVFVGLILFGSKIISL